jgi:hypothetical protein
MGYDFDAYNLRWNDLTFVSPNYKTSCECCSICNTFTTFNYAAGSTPGR